MFQYTTKIRVEHTDATGFLFFPKQFNIALEGFEALLNSYDLSTRDIIYYSEVNYPIVHAESDYLSPLQVGDLITLSIETGKIGNSSFDLIYTIINNQNNKVAGKVKITQVAIQKENRESTALPQNIRNILEEHLP